MQWWEVYIQVRESMSEAASAYLQELGSSAVVIHDHTVLLPQETTCLTTAPPGAEWMVLQGALPQAEALPEQLAALQQFLRTWLLTTSAPAWKLYCRELPNQDYLTQWQHFFHPLVVAERLLIRPSWDTTPVPQHMASITLDPGLAFGTGTHPTTHMCLQMIAQYSPHYQGETLLDVGCGSGILCLAALRLGLRAAVGVDVDAQAIAVAEHNASLNALQGQVQWQHGSLSGITGQFALITANIYLGPLVDMLHSLRRHLAPQGTLLLAGLVEHQAVTLRASLHAAGFTIHTQLTEDGWTALAARHATS